MKVFLTGGAGYIGSHIARALGKSGYGVTIFDNLSTGHRSFTQGFKLVEGNLNDRLMLQQHLPGHDAVIHCAARAYVSESMIAPQSYYETNIAGTLSLLDACLDAQINDFIFASSCSVYGSASNAPISEGHPLDPVSPYGFTKMAVERILADYSRAYGIRHIILRYFNVAGADQTGDIGEYHAPETHLIPLAIAAAGGFSKELEIFGDNLSTPDGTCIRDYVHVSDLADAHVLALRYLRERRTNLTVNLGTGRGTSIFDVLAAIERETGCFVPRLIRAARGGDPARIVANCATARRTLRWSASSTFDDIVRSALRWSKVCATTACSGPNALSKPAVLFSREALDCPS